MSAVGVAIETVASGQADAQLIVGDQAKNHGVGLAEDGRLGRAVERQLHASGVFKAENNYLLVVMMAFLCLETIFVVDYCTTLKILF